MATIPNKQLEGETPGESVVSLNIKELTKGISIELDKAKADFISQIQGIEINHNCKINFVLNDNDLSLFCIADIQKIR